MITEADIISFQAQVWDYYHDHGRHDLPWRRADPDGSFDPYKIMVSELMLQQTQVARVIPKYYQFLEMFPTIQSLAGAELGDVLRIWTGLGYNRRAKFLQQAGQTIVSDFSGVFPATPQDLVKLSGVGCNTAGAILAYAFNQPVTFVETNIRTVFIHHFFKDESAISDAVILNLVTRSQDSDNPRQWYWALMDYGAFLKQSVGNLSRQGKSYTKQSSFIGSRRQIRGHVIRLLSTSSQTAAALEAHVVDDRLPAVLAELLAEDLIKLDGQAYGL